MDRAPPSYPGKKEAAATWRSLAWSH
jgi:hypothetical protein